MPRLLRITPGRGHSLRLQSSSGQRLIRRSTSTAASEAQSPQSTASPPSPRALFLERLSSSNAESFSIRPWSPPTSPRPTEVRVRVAAVSINPIDVWTRSGYGRTLLPLLSPLPRIAGKDATGVITQVGERVWLSRDPAGPGSFAESLVVPMGELSRAPSRISLQTAAAYPFVWTTLWAALVDCAELKPLSVRAMRAGRGATTGSSAFVHGAGGPLGRLAVWTLRAWGYDVTASVKESQDATRIERQLAHLVATSPQDEEQAQSEASGSGRPSLTSALARPHPAPSWLSELPSRGAYSVFLDCVGGPASEAAGLHALREGAGRFVTLRSEAVNAVDEDGLLQGGARALQWLAVRKAHFAARGLGYSWAINRSNAEALAYLANAIDRGCIVPDEELEERTDAERTASSDVVVHGGIERVLHALDQFSESKPQGKLIVSLES